MQVLLALCAVNDMPPRPIALLPDQHLRIRASADWQLRCASGLVWLTCRGRFDDWVLREDEATPLPAGDWLVGALRASVIEVAPGGEAHGVAVPAWRALVSLFARRLLTHPPAGGHALAPAPLRAPP